MLVEIVNVEVNFNYTNDKDQANYENRQVDEIAYVHLVQNFKKIKEINEKVENS